MFANVQDRVKGSIYPGPSSLNSICLLAVFFIIGAQSIQVGDFLIKPAFAGTDVSDPFEQLVKIVLTKIFALFQPFILYYKAFDDEFVFTLIIQFNQLDLQKYAALKMPGIC